MRGFSALGLLFLVAALGCGDGRKAETPYGSAEEVRSYREQIDRIIDEVNGVQDEMERMAVGSSGQATGQNLAKAYERLAPRLESALEELGHIEPPPKLEELHQRMRRLVQLRLDALERAAEGWQVEQATSFEEAEPLYEEAEERFDQANALAVQVNEELEEVDLALAEAEGKNPVS